MVNRKRLGINYTYDENWIGGTYYIENLVKSISTITDTLLPHIVVICKDKTAYKTFLKNTNYPFTSFQIQTGESNKYFQLLNKVLGKLLRVKPFNQSIKNLSAVFPYYNSIQQNSAKIRIYWIPDFQHHFYPEFFSPEENSNRLISEKIVASSKESLVISSENAFEHFVRFNPQATVKTNIVRFAVTLPDFEDQSINQLRKKFGIEGSYYISPNQFWKHKNHIAILKALLLLREQYGKIVKIVFTGKTQDYRNPDYYGTLINFVEENNLMDQVYFLGFIERKEQLSLIKNSLAIIQPSLFEGWSTVIEDAKSLNKQVFASNIPVNIEQLANTNALFFDPNDPKTLVDILERTELTNPLYDEHNYHMHINDFGANFLKIVDES